MNKSYKSNFNSRLMLAVGLGVGLASLGATRVVGADPIFNDRNHTRSMFSDKRALSVGDLLSVIVQENSTATKDVSTKTGKSTRADASIDSFFFSPTQSGLLTKKGSFPALKYGTDSAFNGSGQINNSEKIVARLQVVVKDVLPNGNLVVEGRRQTAFSGETQDMVMRGIVRQSDVTPNNSVFSYQVAEATINIASKGAASNSTKKGWFTRAWDKITPF